MKSWQRYGLIMGMAAAGTGLAHAAIYGGGPAEAYVNAKIAALTSSVSGSITAFGTSFGNAMTQQFEQIISAVAVATKQEALAGNTIATAGMQSGQQLVNAVAAQRETAQVTKAYLDYSPQMGQGYDPCGTGAKQKTLDQYFDSLPAAASARMTTFDTAPGRLAPSTSRAMQERLDNHRQNYCTSSEAQAGLCTLSQLPGGDTDASLLFQAAAPGSLQDKARDAYIEHVLGSPAAQIPASVGQTPQGQAYLAAVNREQALLSIPGYSLARIAAANTQSPAYGNKSANEVLTLRVNQYFGGKEAEQWASAIAAQSPRGLLVEAAKMGGLEVWIHHQQYQQSQRLEAGLAALLLAEADNVKGPTAEDQQKAMRDQVSSQVQ
ncbi:MAG: hypothetical protein WC617_12760 [Rhodanobacter sp.]|jgi:hypothetical protein